MSTRLAILADVHLGTPDTQFPGQDLAYAPDLLRRAVNEVNLQQPHELILVGDLVNMGTDAEYTLAREILGPLRLPISSIPGNHELVKGSLPAFSAQAIGARVDETVDHASGLTFALLNSGIEGLPVWHWHGRVGDAALRLLDGATADRGDRPLVVFCHHPPEGTVRVARHPMMTLLNSDDVMARLMRHPAPVVMFCGHTHVPDVYRRRNLTIVGCPPLCFWPHAFLMVELRDGLLHVATHRLIESPQQSPDVKINEPGYLDEREPWVPQVSIRVGPAFPIPATSV